MVIIFKKSDNNNSADYEEISRIHTKRPLIVFCFIWKVAMFWLNIIEKEDVRKFGNLNVIDKFDRRCDKDNW